LGDGREEAAERGSSCGSTARRFRALLLRIGDEEEENAPSDVAKTAINISTTAKRRVTLMPWRLIRQQRRRQGNDGAADNHRLLLKRFHRASLCASQASQQERDRPPRRYAAETQRGPPTSGNVAPVGHSERPAPPGCGVPGCGPARLRQIPDGRASLRRHWVRHPLFLSLLCERHTAASTVLPGIFNVTKRRP
jgi:hypothetical protein